MDHTLMMYYEAFPQSETTEWEELIFGDVPWCESFNKVVPQKTNAGALIKTFVLEADLPEEAEDGCLYLGDRMRFTHSVLSETSVDDPSSFGSCGRTKRIIPPYVSKRVH
jgi:hypothetical protein